MQYTREYSERYKGYQISVHIDDDTLSPREDDNFGTIVAWHKKYTLGDIQPTINSDLWLTSFDQYNPGAVVLPVYLYDHSGITISTAPFSCPWDSGQIGYIYATREKIRQEFNVKTVTKKARARAIEILQSEIATYDAFLRGDVYGYIVSKDYKQIDACWSFYGLDACINAAKESIDALIAHASE